MTGVNSARGAARGGGRRSSSRARKKPAPRPAQLPPRELLTRERIIDAAVAITATEGVKQLTMARLAKRLEVTAAALYKHADSKDDILVSVQDRLMQQVDISRFEDSDIRTALRAWARSYRDVMAAHPALISAISVMPIDGAEATTAMYETVAAGLLDAGWDEGDIIPTIVALESFIFGSAYDVTADRNIFDLEDSREAPVFASAAMLHFTDRTREEAVDEAFELGLDALLAQLTVRCLAAGLP